MNSEITHERIKEDDWTTVEYLSILYSEKDKPNELYEKKLERIIKEQPKLSSINIRKILLDIFCYINSKDNGKPPFFNNYKKKKKQL